MVLITVNQIFTNNTRTKKCLIINFIHIFGTVFLVFFCHIVYVGYICYVNYFILGKVRQLMTGYQRNIHFEFLIYLLLLCLEQ